MNENNDIVIAFARLYKAEMNRRNNGDYEINPIQMNKFLDAVSYFSRKAAECGETLEPIRCEPKEEHGGLTAHFIVFDSYGKDLQEFSRIIGYCSALSVDTTTDNKCCISITIPNIYMERNKPKPMESGSNCGKWNEDQEEEFAEEDALFDYEAFCRIFDEDGDPDESEG